MSTASGNKKDERLDAVFHALADTTRRRLLAGLARGPLAVTELSAPFPISLPAISKHLAVLERAGLVRRERDGRFQRCHLVTASLDDASAFIEHYRSFWRASLDQLAEFVEGGARRATAQHKKNRRK
jgi:DNA-binding transcriptional ArsR family regulator